MPTVYYEYDDVFIVPCYSMITSRSEVSTRSTLTSRHSNLTSELEVPVISSNMDTITEHEMCHAMSQGGGVGAMHRFLSIESAVEEYHKAPSGSFVSIGVNRDTHERTEALYEAGARFFIVDIAHGHTMMMKNILTRLRTRYNRDIFVMAGNVGTPQAVKDLESWGADAIKVGIGGGFVCETKNVTGVNTPMFTTIQKCAAVTDQAIIADGGARAYGDVAKAIAAGASAVMSGYFFAGCPETPSRARVYDPVTNTETTIYRGMASRDAMNVIRSEGTMPTPEGRSTVTKSKPSAVVVMQEIAGGLRSAYSYVGSKDTTEFQSKVEFGYRR
jgi:IMP dehydrogenase/GMP reductase